MEDGGRINLRIFNCVGGMGWVGGLMEGKMEACRKKGVTCKKEEEGNMSNEREREKDEMGRG